MKINAINNRTGSVRIGFPYRMYPYRPAVINISGQCILRGTANIQSGCELNVSWRLLLGNNFNCNEDTIINASDTSEIGDNVVVGQC